MSTEWTTYLGLLGEMSELPEIERRGRAAAEAAYTSEAKRLEVALASTQRELRSLEERNSRLQIGVRELVRSLDLTIPAKTADDHIEFPQLDPAIRSAEHDLVQLRTSLTHLRRQRGTPPPPPPPPPPPITATPQPLTTSNQKPTRGTTPIILAIAGSCAAIVIILLMVLR